MEKNRIEENKWIYNTEKISVVLTGIIIFVFFTFFYNHHLHFAEQTQLFLLTRDFFLEKIGLPGGFNGYIGGFLTQCFYLPYIGALIITLLLIAIQQVTKRILLSINDNQYLFPLTFFPMLLAGIMLLDELYPLSAVTGILSALLFGWLYTKLKKRNHRFTTGLVIIPVAYLLLGGVIFALLLIMLVYELITSLKAQKRTLPEGRKNFKILHYLSYLILAVCVPLLVQRFFILQPVKLAFMSEFFYNIPDKIPSLLLIIFIIPSILIFLYYIIPSHHLRNIYTLVALMIIVLAVGYTGFRLKVNFDAEETMTYDYLARNQQWDKIISHAERSYPKNYLSLAMFNLALAKTGQLGDKLFRYDQHGVDGLFLGFAHEYITPLMGNEIFYHLGLINASQQYVFESMEVMPKSGRSVRSVKRLAETNLINGQYRVAEKYLKLLERTLFYRKWARDTKKYLNNEDLINQHPDYGEKRKLLVSKDFFFHAEDIENILYLILRDNPRNKLAFEYLMAIYLLNKDLQKFIDCLPMMEDLNYSEIPVSYQEAIMYYISMINSDPLTGSRLKISDSVKSRMQSYADIYTKNPDARDLLRQYFGGTYWYYLHYN